MGAFLPSEVARLVLGYLEEQECAGAYDAFLSECAHLVECRGRRAFFTSIMGMSLGDMLDDYCAAHAAVASRATPKCSTLAEKVLLLMGDRHDEDDDASRSESDFPRALGLSKKRKKAKNERTPRKKDTSFARQKSFGSAKKIAPLENLPNTMTSALLDCKEFQEQIAKNINQMRNSANENVVKETIAFDDDSTQLDNIIKAIVEKTEKDPIFDQFLNDRLIPSVESIIGSDSETGSRPETSTPEKSRRSGSEARSPVSSCRSFEPALDRTERRTIKKSGRSKTVDDKMDQASNWNSREVNSAVPNSNDTKKYPPKWRGGKRMDILRENYEEYELEGNDSVQSCISEAKTVEPVEKTDLKIKILSNERVHLDVGSIINKDVPLKIASEKIDANKDGLCDSESRRSDFQDVLKDAKLVPKEGGEKINASTVENDNREIQNIPEKNVAEDKSSQILDIAMEDANLEVPDRPTNAPSESLDIRAGNDCVANLNKAMQMSVPKIVTGKPPEIVIVDENRKIVYTEAEIMKMPTIIVLSSPDRIVSDLQESKTFKQHLRKEPAERKFIPILPKGKSSESNQFPNIDNSVDCKRQSEKVAKNSSQVLQSFSSTTAVENFEDMKEISLKADNKIIDGVVDSSQSNLSSKILPLYFHNDNIELVDSKHKENILASSFKNEFIDIDFKIVTPEKNTFKKLCSSTPTRKNNYVKILDFSTPGKSISKRKAVTSPKKILPGFKKENKLVKSCLFAPLNEESHNEDDVTVLSNSSEISEKPILDDQKQSVLIECSNVETNNGQSTTEKSTEKSIKKPVRASYDWDKDLRSSLGLLPCIKRSPRKKKHKRKGTITGVCIDVLSKSVEKDGRLLEEALMNSSNGTDNLSTKCSSAKKKSERKSKTSRSKKEVEMSISTDSIDVGAHSSNYNESQANTLSSLKDKDSKSKRTKCISSKNSPRKRKINSNVKKPIKKNKSALKIKLGTKGHLEASNKSDKKTKSVSKSEDFIIGDCVKSFDEAEIHETPEFPKESRTQPVERKFNITSFLETPMKTNLLDCSIRTPLFLSPDSNCNPMSDIKMLGCPTPNFDSSAFLAFDNLDKNCGQINSGATYYKPDEVIMPSLVESAGQSVEYSESVKKNDSILKTNMLKSNESSKRKNEKHVKLGDIESNNGDKVTSTTVNKDISNCSSGELSTRVLRPRLAKSSWAALLQNKKTPIKNKNKTSSPVFQNKKTTAKKLNETFDSYNKSGHEIGTVEVEHSIEKENDALLNEAKISQLKLLDEKRKRIISKMKSENVNERKFKKENLLLKSAKEIGKALPSKKVSNKNENGVKNLKAKVSISTAINSESEENRFFNCAPISKSRRKSSTPRKLDKSIFDSEIGQTPSKAIDHFVVQNACSVILISNENIGSAASFTNNEILSPVLQKSNCENKSKDTFTGAQKSDFQLNLEQEGFSAEEAKEIDEKLCDDSDVQIADITLCGSEMNIYASTPLISNKGKQPENCSTSFKCKDIDDEVVSEKQTVSEAGPLLNESVADCNEEDDIIEWNYSQCNQNTSNYLTEKFESENSQKLILKATPNNVDVDRYTLNVEIFNTVKNVDETRVIKANTFTSLIDIIPYIAPKNVSSSDFNFSNCHHIKNKLLKNNVRPPAIPVEETEKEMETKAAVASILPEVPPVFDLNVSLEESTDNLASPGKNSTRDKVKNICDISFDYENDDLMDMAITNASKADKRKREGDDFVSFGTKKSKSVIPDQQLLKKMDIEDILSKLHPG